MADKPMNADEYAAGIKRIFETPEAFVASLPRCIWVETDNGWVSYPRD